MHVESKRVSTTQWKLETIKILQLNLLCLGNTQCHLEIDISIHISRIHIATVEHSRCYNKL